MERFTRALDARRPAGRRLAALASHPWIPCYMHLYSAAPFFLRAPSKFSVNTSFRCA